MTRKNRGGGRGIASNSPQVPFAFWRSRKAVGEAFCSMAVFAGDCAAPDGTLAAVKQLDREDLAPLAPVVPEWMEEAQALDLAGAGDP